MNNETQVAIRDFVIFAMKLFLDGIKDGVLFAGALIGLSVDLAFKRTGSDRLFYRVMRSGEKFDKWLNLHGALENADPEHDGLFGASEAGSDTLLGQIEQAVRGGDQPRGSRWKEPFDTSAGAEGPGGGTPEAADMNEEEGSR